MENKKQPLKSRLSFVLRDPNEFSHSKGINSVVLGKSYDKQNGKFLTYVHDIILYLPK